MRSWRSPRAGRHALNLCRLAAALHPSRSVGRRVSQDVVDFQAGVAIVVKAVAVEDVGVDTPDVQVHLGHAPGSVIGFLTIDGDVALDPVAVSGGVGADEVDGSYEHTRGTAAGVYDPCSVGLKHLHQKPHERTRGVELAAFLERDLSRGCEQSDNTILQPTAVRYFPLVRFGPDFYSLRN